MRNDSSSTWHTTRRQLLRTLGAGVALSAGVGTAAAEGNIGSLSAPNDESDRGSNDTASAKEVTNTCPEGTTLLAKYNRDETGAFVFETGREELGIDGSEITFSDVQTKPSEPAEVVGFDWNSGVYDVHSVGVKFGNNVERWTVSGGTTGTVDVRDRYEGYSSVPAISNVIFCIEVHWQVDFGLGPISNPPTYSGQEESTLLMTALGQSPKDMGYRYNPSFEPRTDGTPIHILGPDEFDLSNGTATVTFAVTGSESVTVHLTSFETPGPFEPDEIPSQVLLDSMVVTADPGFNQLTVDVPSL